MSTVILTDYEHAKSELSGIIDDYNKERKHSSLNYLTPVQYYRGNPDELLKIRESKIEKAKILRREMNMKERKGVKGQEPSHNSFRYLSRIEINITK